MNKNKSETSDLDLSIVSEFIKMYDSGQESNKGVKNFAIINKSTQSEINKPKKKKQNKSEQIETLELIDKSAPPIQTDGSSKKIRPKKKSKNTINEELEVQRMNLVTKLMAHDNETLLDVSNVRTSDRKSKKRNKSATITQDDAEVKTKKVKTNDASNEKKNLIQEGEKLSRSHRRRLKKLQSKENQNSNKDNVETIKEKVIKKKESEESSLDALASDKPATGASRKVKKAKKFKAQNKCVAEIATEENVIGDQSSEKDNTAKKSKKKKRKAKSLQDANTDAKMDGEPAVKNRKREVKPEAIARDLQHLNIGDNAHTLSNLLDEMTVVDKNKKKDRQKRNKNKRKKTVKFSSEASTDKAAETGNATEEEKKVKWHKRKWNKDKKGDEKPRLQNSVLVENLPLKIMFSYKTLLSEHFGKCGTVAGVGVAEAYPTEEPKPVFTTTVYFKEEESSEKALEEDNTLLEGNRIRVRLPLPPTQTTVVVKARAPLCDQSVSSALCGAGRIRTIRHLVKGKQSESTAFVQFDGPEAVERALKMAEDVKISGEKIRIYKFKYRSKTKSHQSKNEDTANDAGDDRSND